MSDRIFLDTNILVTAFDRTVPKKYDIAREIIRNSITDTHYCVSAQVLSEFYVISTRKIPDPLTSEEAFQIIESLRSLRTIELDRLLVIRAIETCRRYTISYWDALIIAAAERGGCSKIFSEDLNAGQYYHTILLINPFK